jgi:hypothetical protein
MSATSARGLSAVDNMKYETNILLDCENRLVRRGSEPSARSKDGCYFVLILTGECIRSALLSSIS